MQPREKFMAALDRKPITGLVPHFELVFFLTMEAFGKVHPSHRHYSQWDQMSEKERELHRNEMAQIYIDTAERYDHSAIFIHPNPGSPEEVMILIDKIRERSGDKYFIMMHGDATYSIPDGDHMQDFIYRLVDEPDKVKEDARKYLEKAIRFAEIMAKHGGLDGFALCSDYCFNNGPFLSPAMFSEFITPYLAELTKSYREMGFYVIKHTDGNIMPILDQLVQTNPHALHSIDPQAKVDIAEVKRLVGDKVCLIGNVNCGLLQTGTEDEVRDPSGMRSGTVCREADTFSPPPTASTPACPWKDMSSCSTSGAEKVSINKRNIVGQWDSQRKTNNKMEVLFLQDDIKILRKLAYKYAEIANSPENARNIELHKAVNDLRMIRPVVLIDELPWNEMNIDDELTLVCSDPELRYLEWTFRTNIYKHKHMPADMVVPPFVGVQKIIHNSGIGVEIEEDILKTDQDNHIVSHKYKDQLATEEDLEKLRAPELIYDKEATLKRFNFVGEILGDIMPVKLVGVTYFYYSTWDQIAMFRGVTNLLIDLVERPKFTHRMVRKFTDIGLSYLDQYEALDLLDTNGFSLHCTPIHTNDLPRKDFDGEKVTRKNIWGRGMAQIFASVSKKMHYDFDIQYTIETIGQCGLAYYGCCEPLDKKIDIVEKIPNLRKIGVTPWADVNVAAEAINTKYVVSSKPNPTAVAVPMLDKDALRKEISTILDACKRNNCSVDITLKDISTCCRRPENIFEWEKTVMEMVKNY